MKSNKNIVKEDREKLAANIKRLCAERSWTMSRLNRESSVSLPTIKALIDQKAESTRILTLFKLSRAFGVPMSELLE